MSDIREIITRDSGPTRAVCTPLCSPLQRGRLDAGKCCFHRHRRGMWTDEKCTLLLVRCGSGLPDCLPDCMLHDRKTYLPRVCNQCQVVYSPGFREINPIHHVPMIVFEIIMFALMSVNW
ncbi:hypothetical protein XENOCAPTIV_018371 [Xenoophorus captivus]|uniref:Uncharacterized protein n=1 Tax=Xenoophorus captivus TaxID=1517983 RepID=A0ABV0QTW8_9TELE